MRTLSGLGRAAIPAAVVALAAAGLGVAVGAIPDGGTLHSCVNTTTYGANVRVIDPALPAGDPRKTCKAGETAFDIGAGGGGATGPTGPTGPGGAPSGPAGGELAGTYPNPQIAALPYIEAFDTGTQNNTASGPNVFQTITLDTISSQQGIALAFGSFTIPRSGVYYMSGDFFFGSGAPTTVITRITVNGTEVPGSRNQVPFAAAESHPLGFHKLLNLATGDVVRVQYEASVVAGPASSNGVPSGRVQLYYLHQP